jgi:hypothetical protein
MEEKQIIYKQEPLLALRIGIGVWLGFFLIVLTIAAICYIKPGLIGRFSVFIAKDISLAIREEVDKTTTGKPWSESYSNEESAEIVVKLLQTQADAYQLEKKKPISSLDDLVPEYMEVVPQDPWGDDYVVTIREDGTAQISCSNLDSD